MFGDLLLLTKPITTATRMTTAATTAKTEPIDASTEEADEGGDVDFAVAAFVGVELGFAVEVDDGEGEVEGADVGSVCVGLGVEAGVDVGVD